MPKGKEMKKTKELKIITEPSKDHQIEELKLGLRQVRKEADDEKQCTSFFQFTTVVLVALLIGVGISLQNMDEKFNERNKAANYLRSYIDHKNSEQEFKDSCKRLAEVSKKDFRLSPYRLVCRYYGNDAHLDFYETSEIETAILHYKLGSAGK